MNIKFQVKKAYKEYLFRYKYKNIKSENKSVFFFTFHKCASSLFSKHILRKIDDLQHVDYANYLADKSVSYNKDLFFKENGCIYGPIRLSANGTIVHELLVKPTAKFDFIKDKKAIFLVRDPRDILVSSYHSFGFTHPLNEVKEKANRQLGIRENIQSLAIDDYVLKNLNKQIDDFNLVVKMSSKCNMNVILKYEDMVDDFDSFISDFNKIVYLNDDIVKTLYTETRPKEKVDIHSHKRSGESRRFVKELKPETIKELNKGLNSILNQFGYKI